MRIVQVYFFMALPLPKRLRADFFLHPRLWRGLELSPESTDYFLL